MLLPTTSGTHGVNATLEPLDTLRDQLPDWTVADAPLDRDVMGYCDPDRKTIWLSRELSRRERRCTLMHEALHAVRGDTDEDPDAELAVQIETARRLVPIAALLLVLERHTHPDDICDALDVDIDVLRTRLRHLNDDDVDLVRRALANASPGQHSTRGAIARWWHFHNQPEPTPQQLDRPRHVTLVVAR